MLSSSNNLNNQESHQNAYGSSGTSPTAANGTVRVHLFGVGLVGSELLGRLPETCRLVAVTDSSATVHVEAGLDPVAIRDFKRAGVPLAGHARGDVIARDAALRRVGADLVIDAMPSDPRRAESHRAWASTVIDSGAALAMASKQALKGAAGEWIRPDLRDRVGLNAVLGGTGDRLQAEIAELREDAVACAVAGSATSTLIIDAIERGARVDQGIERAERAGVLEPDPELDFRGEDAAVKLAIVAGALWGGRVDASAISREDLRDLDPDLLVERALRGSTTRLVGRATRGGDLSLRYEEVPRSTALAIGLGEVAYAYELGSGETRVHRGQGVGPAGTAEALAADVERLASGVVRARRQ